VYEEVEEDDEEALLWCLRGYPFKCPVLPLVEVIDLDDPDLLFILDEFCRNCLKRLEYEWLYESFAV